MRSWAGTQTSAWTLAVFGRVAEGMDLVKKIQAAHTLPAGQRGAYGPETLDPPIKILKAYRK